MFKRQRLSVLLVSIAVLFLLFGAIWILHGSQAGNLGLSKSKGGLNTTSSIVTSNSTLLSSTDTATLVTNSSHSSKKTVTTVNTTTVNLPSNDVNFGMNGWTFNILGSGISNIAITQGIQQSVFVDIFDNCVVYDYDPTNTTYAIGVYNLTSKTQSTPIVITTPNEDGPINLLVVGSTLYFGYGSFLDDLAAGAIYSTNNLNSYTLVHSWSSGFQPESIGYYTYNGTLLVSGDGGPNTGIVYKLVNGVATIIGEDPNTGDATFLAMFNSTMIVTGGTFPQTPIFSNNLSTWVSNDTGFIGEYTTPYVFPWSWSTELIYGKLWMPNAIFTTLYPDESGLASFGGGSGNTSYRAYPSSTDSYYSIADGLVGGTIGMTLGSENSFPGPAIIQPFYSDGSVGPAIFEFGISGNWAVSSMVYDGTTNEVYGALLGQSQREIVLIAGNNGTEFSNTSSVMETTTNSTSTNATSIGGNLSSVSEQFGSSNPIMISHNTHFHIILFAADARMDTALIGFIFLDE